MSLPFSSETREFGRRFQEFVSGQWLCDAVTASQGAEDGNASTGNMAGISGGCRLDPVAISRSIQYLAIKGVSKIGSFVQQRGPFRSNSLRNNRSIAPLEPSYLKTSESSQSSEERNWLMQLVTRSLDWEVIQGQKRSRKDHAEMEERDLAMALASNKKATLLEFYSQKCRLCRSLNSVLDEMEREYGGWLSIVKADVGNKNWLPEIGHYNIHYVPCFVLLDANGNALVRTGAPYSREHVLTGLSYIVESVQPFQESLHQYNQNSKK